MVINSFCFSGFHGTHWTEQLIAPTKAFVHRAGADIVASGSGTAQRIFYKMCSGARSSWDMFCLFNHPPKRLKLCVQQFPKIQSENQNGIEIGYRCLFNSSPKFHSRNQNGIEIGYRCLFNSSPKFQSKNQNGSKPDAIICSTSPLRSNAKLRS